MEVHLNPGSFFAVPAAVADQLKLATHAQIKVLLYVLCHADAALTVGEITRACGVTEHEVEEAMCYWTQNGVISNAPAVPVTHVQTVQAVAAAPAVQQPAAPVPPAEEPRRSSVPVSSSSFRLRPDDIARRRNENAEVAEMLSCAEQFAKRPLNYTELNSLIWMHEYLGIQPELILILIAYCAESGQFHVRTMEHIAVQWQENSITTADLAKEDVQRRIEQRSYNGQMMRIFGMSKPPTAAQQEIFSRWCALRMPPEMIRIAYDKMRDKISMDAGSRQQLKYMNGIIERWAAAGIYTAEGAEQEDIRHRSEIQKAAAQPAKRRTSAQSAKKPETRPAQSSIDLAEAEKLINKF